MIKLYTTNTECLVRYEMFHLSYDFSQNFQVLLPKMAAFSPPPLHQLSVVLGKHQQH